MSQTSYYNLKNWCLAWKAWGKNHSRKVSNACGLNGHDLVKSNWSSGNFYMDQSNSKTTRSPFLGTFFHALANFTLRSHYFL